MSMHHTQWNKKMYLSKEIVSDEMDENGNYINGYTEPVEYEINYQPVSAETAMKEIGYNSSQMYKAIIKRTDTVYNELIEEQDEGALVYLNGASPTKKPLWDKSNRTVEPKNGYWANYKIYSIRTSNIAKQVYFEKYKTTGAK